MDWPYLRYLLFEKYFLVIAPIVYLSIAIPLTRFYFKRSQGHKGLKKLIGHSFVLGLFWGVGLLGCQGFALPGPSGASLVVQLFFLDPYLWFATAFVPFLISWAVYFLILALEQW